jgi:hypothetical protein
MLSLLWSHIEVTVDLLLVLLGGNIGLWHAKRVVRKAPNVGLDSIHRHVRGPIIGVCLIMFGVVLLSVAGVVRSVVWAFPLLLELLYPFLRWGSICLVFSCLASLSLRVAWHSRHRERPKLTFALVLLVMAVLIFRWKINFPIPADSYEVENAGDVILQTTGSSCVPATMANILVHVGLSESERSLASELFE